MQAIRHTLLSLGIFTAAVFILAGCVQEEKEWQPLFDGESLDGWTASENKASFKIQNGAIVCDGPRSHLFYTGKVNKGSFKNFELRLEVKTSENANSGIYFHTEYQDEGWPAKGYECQVYSGVSATGVRSERKKTGSLYAIRNCFKPPVGDNEWFDYRIMVKANHVWIWINDHLISEYIEPEDPWRRENMQGRVISEGTFALQCHDPKSTVYYRNIEVKVLPDDLPREEAPYDPEYDRKITELHSQNFPLIDYHIHLKGDLDLEGALQHSRKYGITYGIAVNCGEKFPIDTEQKLTEWLSQYEQPPQTYLAMQAEGREWVDLFSEVSRSKFDYVFTDAMTWTNSRGKRMRLWMPDEVEVGDPQVFMDELVHNIEQILTEPIDIYVNATYLPAEIADQYDALWTEERMDRVINALLENDVAFEISARYKIPSFAFISRAREAGVKFAFGTNNSDADYGHLEYCVQAIEECGLQPEDMWFP